MHLSIITPCSRPQNIDTIRRSILEALSRAPQWNSTWIIVDDAESSPTGPEASDRLAILRGHHLSANTSISGNCQRNDALDLAGAGWACFLDDDTTMHPDAISVISPHCIADPEINVVVSQQYANGAIRCDARPENVSIARIDSGQVFLARSAIGDTRWELMRYEADGCFIAEIYSRHGGKFVFLPQAVSIYNALR